jgi:hypothetical protein
MKNKTRNHFKINRDTPIVIYGAAAAGLRGYFSLKTLNGYNVVGFFDKRANEINSQFDLPVWAPTTDPPFKKENLLVIVCVKNVFEHGKIVNLLTESDYHNIIFLPLETSNKHTGEFGFASISRNYQRIFNDTNPELRYELESIPSINSLEPYHYRDYAVLKKTETSVIVSFPLADIFIQANTSFDMLHNQDMLCNILALVPHIDLFQLFNGNGGHADQYLDFCLAGARNVEMMYGGGTGKISVTDSWQKNIIQNRRYVFDAMNRDIEINNNYFIQHAPVCVLQKNHFLLMKSAKHRAAFFITKNRTFIPVEISHGDYEIILNNKALNEIITFFQANRIYELNVPIQHPYLYKYPSKMWNYYELFIHKVVYHLAVLFNKEYDISRILIEDSLPDEGALSRCLSRIGFRVSRTITNTNDKALSMLFDRLFYISNTTYKIDYEPATIICCNKCDLDQYISFENTRALFILSEDGLDPEVSGFEIKELLFQTIWDSKAIAGYMLENLKYRR